MERLITTPYKFVWQIKNPQDYWSDFIENAKYIVFVDGEMKGKFNGVNRTFDDDMYYVNFWNEDQKLEYCSVYKNTEIVLERRYI